MLLIAHMQENMQKHAKMNKCCNSTQEIKIPIAQELKDDAATY